MRIIAVVMGEPDSKTRSKEISEMLDYAFAQYKIKNLLKEKYVGKYIVDKGEERYAKVIPKDEVTILSKKAEKDKKANYKIEINKLKAPIKKGEVIGNLKIKENGKAIRTIDLTVDKNIKKISLWKLYLRNLKDIFTSSIAI